MRVKKLFSALLAAALLATGAQAAVTPKGNEYVETKLMAAKSASSAMEYAMLMGKMTGSNADRAALANSGFVSETTEKLTVEPGDTFYLAVKFDASHIPAAYNGICGANLYYLYDADVFTPDVGIGYVNHITGGTAGIQTEETPATYLSDCRMASSNSDMLDPSAGHHYISLVLTSISRKYFIPSESTWDFVFPVTVAKDAYKGEYTFSFYTGLVNKMYSYGYILSREPHGKADESLAEGVPSSQVKANDMVIEVVNAPARPDTPQPTEPEEPDESFYVNGRPDGTFDPAGAIRRDEFVKMLTVATGLYREGHNYPNQFADVPAGNWAARYIGCAAENGLVNGLPDGTFGAARTITRGEAAAILARVLKLEKSDQRPFSDLDGDWAAGYVAALAEGGYITGYPDGTFRSASPLHRVEAVKMINSVLGISFTPEELQAAKALPSPFSDVASSYWAYADILYAAGRLKK